MVGTAVCRMPNFGRAPRVAFQTVTSQSIVRPRKAAPGLMSSSTTPCGLLCEEPLRLPPSELSPPSVCRALRPTFIRPGSTMAGGRSPVWRITTLSKSDRNPMAGRLAGPSLLVCAQPQPGRYRHIADGSRHSADLYGAGVLGRFSMDLGSAAQCQLALVGWSGYRPGQGHGRPSAVHARGSEVARRLSGIAWRQCPSLLGLGRRPGSCLPPLARRRWGGRDRGRDLGGHDMVGLPDRIPERWTLER